MKSQPSALSSPRGLDRCPRWSCRPRPSRSHDSRTPSALARAARRLAAPPRRSRAESVGASPSEPPYSSVAMVGERREELVEQEIAVRAVQLEHLEAQARGALGGGDELGLHAIHADAVDALQPAYATSPSAVARARRPGSRRPVPWRRRVSPTAEIGAPWQYPARRPAVSGPPPFHGRCAEALRPAWAIWMASLTWCPASRRAHQSTIALERRLVGVAVQAEASLGDAALSLETCVASTHISPAPLTSPSHAVMGEVPRLIAEPSTAEYWHIGDTTMRLGNVDIAAQTRRAVNNWAIDDISRD